MLEKEKSQTERHGMHHSTRVQLLFHGLGIAFCSTRRLCYSMRCAWVDEACVTDSSPRRNIERNEGLGFRV